MADENATNEQTPPENPEAPENTAVAAAPEEAKLHQTVEITDAGPCKKHVKVTVDRGDIDGRFDEKITELVRDSRAHVDGFRPGKAPRKVIERRFKSDLTEQVKTEVLMASLEQLATENNLSPLAPPDIDPAKIEIPEQGPLVYEFDVEVRPEFDLPNYKGLKLRRPVRTFSDEDVNKEMRRLLEPMGQLVPKQGKDGQPPEVQQDDTIVADVTIRAGDQLINELKEVRVKVEPRLALSDGVADHFARQLAGAKVGDERTVQIRLSEDVSDEALRGKDVTAAFKINDVKTTRLPELTQDILDQFGVRSEDQLRELIRTFLDRRLEYAQRQAARQQVLAQINEASQWELPQDLLRRQARRTLARQVMEMRSAGMSEDQIRGRQQLLQQDVLASTAAALKEHFVLQKIAEVEKLEIGEQDIDDEIERIADRSGESPRRVRARFEKEDLIEAMATELLERKALDLILSTAEYEDVPVGADEEEREVAAVEAQAVPGQPTPPEGEAGEGAPQA